eukprot:CAMPEP_0114482342 /NCGR_PEP_ID=MMETSP0104-20121206/18197_1 /TAXON_ID=37642 ORGANISM="Paraphysomonas imperforata, Strain PA2" /NCGR_SAMPLE_ID=MMETSP0104 /ASSEMBLY_ACC=CAM_ASM_000202 /LENGTH=36 /DNA_ID= /DNA_START= /DNA_END= /DNA_ORIENTATION=
MTHFTTGPSAAINFFMSTFCIASPNRAAASSLLLAA